MKFKDNNKFRSKRNLATLVQCTIRVSCPYSWLIKFIYKNHYDYGNSSTNYAQRSKPSATEEERFVDLSSPSKDSLHSGVPVPKTGDKSSGILYIPLKCDHRPQHFGRNCRMKNIVNICFVKTFDNGKTRQISV